MQAITKLSEIQLRKLGEKFTSLVEEKHQWQWRNDVMDLINHMKAFNPNWSNQDLYDRVGETFIDWDAQALKDNRDWYESFSEITAQAALTVDETSQLLTYLEGDSN